MARFQLEQFNLSIDKWVAKSKSSARVFAIVALQDLAEQVVISTPGPGNSIQVNPPPGQPTGFLRGSWRAGLNGLGSGEGPADPDGGAAIAQANLTLAGLQIGDVFSMVNNAEYAARLEFGFVGEDSMGRTYNEAPRAFVRGSIAMWPTIAKKAAERVASGNLGGRGGGISGGQFATIGGGRP